jgi:4-hydroxy-3-polyprenylbenzoate decarboxylase
MGYRTLAACVADLERHKHLVRIDVEIDPHLEMAEIHRRVYQNGGPALLFTRPKGCAFPMVSNLFGTLQRTRFLFRDTLDAVRLLVDMKVDPSRFWKNPWKYRSLLWTLWHTLPKMVRSGPILQNQIPLTKLPHLVCWPRDGGAFITLPQVYTENVEKPGWRQSNLGMYRVQLTGGQYAPDRQAGLHYQIHRGIGVHHAKAIEKGVPFRVNVFVGGPPALTLAAVMPLPEGLPELAFAGALGGRRIELCRPPDSPPVARGGTRILKDHPWLPIPAEADFAIVGTVDPNLQLPEGPFGDHLGYYSLAHDFPVLNVERVYHRPGAIWPFTVVGRPPQEDTSFGAIIHEITGPIIPTVLAGVHAVHAVDATGVHPLLLAIGSERYVPYAAQRRPQELLTLANAILGQGQLSLAKFLFIVAREDNPDLDIHDIPAFLRHLLERIDFQRDLHFQTRTTIDTLDYSGTGFNEGSKVVWAAAGPVRRKLATELPADFTLPVEFGPARVILPGVVAVQGPPYGRRGRKMAAAPIVNFCWHLEDHHELEEFPLFTVVDDVEFAARSLNNWLWTVFTRTNPAADTFGVESHIHQKHWGCAGPVVLDARIKPHHAPPLVEDPAVVRRVEVLAVQGGPLAGLI